MLQARIVVTGVRRSPGSSGRLPAEPREDPAETPPLDWEPIARTGRPPDR